MFTDRLNRSRLLVMVGLAVIGSLALGTAAEAQQAVAPAMAQERIEVTPGKMAWVPGEDFTFTLTSEPKGPPGTTPNYTWFIYTQRMDTGTRRYYPNFVAGQETDILGNTSNFPAFEVPTLTNFSMLGPNGWNGNQVSGGFGSIGAGISSPGMYSIVVELRDPETGAVRFQEREQFVLGTGVNILQGSITTDTTLSNDQIHLLRGAVFVQNGATLTIERGTIVLGETATNGTLIIATGAKIMAVGTKGQPIIFTSDQPVGDRARADWGGLIINGLATINLPGGIGVGEGDTGQYGGNDDNDSSGRLSYVRVEFAGTEFSADNELNGIAFQGVGRNTQVDHIQVHYNQDDGIEMFGGTVDWKYVLVTGARDDSIDWTDGWRGRGQFAIAQQNGEEADQGVEADNNGETNSLLPRSNPTLYNLTFIGDPDNNEGPESDTGILVRAGTAGTFRNFIVLGFKETGLDIDQDSTIAEANAGNLTFDNGIVFNNNPNISDDIAPFTATIMQVDPLIVDPYALWAPDFRPGWGSPALNASNVRTPPDDGFFDSSVTFLGAVDPADDFTKGWSTTLQD